MAKRRKDKKICAECGQRKALRFSQRRVLCGTPNISSVPSVGGLCALVPVWRR